jgi:hypothetical protein
MMFIRLKEREKEAETWKTIRDYIKPEPTIPEIIKGLDDIIDRAEGKKK